MKPPLLLAVLLLSPPSFAAEPLPLEARVRELEEAVRRLRDEHVAQRLETALKRAETLRAVFTSCLLPRADGEPWVNPGQIEFPVVDAPTYAALRERLPWLPAAIAEKAVFPGPSQPQVHALLTEFALLLREAAAASALAEPRIRVLTDWAYETRFRWPGSDFLIRVLEWKPKQEIEDTLRDAAR
ncbi:MAG: hypothetical protein HY553_08260 [Elusimicrobia bacterium]|nr:hypothetical protein [Elusimicrobiota bacterium]